MYDESRQAESDRALEERLATVQLDDRTRLREVTRGASPRQVFSVLLPFVYDHRPDLRERIRRETRPGSIRWIVDGPDGGVWRIRFLHAGMEVDCDADAPVRATLRLTAADLTALREARLQPQLAMAKGRLQVRGDLGFVLNHPGLMPV